MAHRHHVFVCLNRRPLGHPKGCCADRGAPEVLDRFRGEFEARHLWESVRLASSSCLGPCEMGPTVVVYPDAVWYGRVTPDDVPEIVERHLVGGQPLERLRIPG